MAPTFSSARARGSGAVEPERDAELALGALGAEEAKRLIASYLSTHKIDLEQLLKSAASEGGAKARSTPTKGAKPSKPTLERRISEPLHVANDFCRLGDQLYDVDTVRDPHSVNAQLLVKPEPVFHGERSEKARDAAHIHHFPLRVVFDGLTSGLEASSKFRCTVGQMLGGRYKVLQYIGSGTFGHTVHCEDMQCTDEQHRWVCVKISKTSKDVFDQNLWEVKVLKLLRERMGDDLEAAEQLPALLDTFYYRETLFVVYELLRDNLYHIYKYLGEQKLPTYFTPARCREVARQVLTTLKALHAHGVIHADLKPENILIESLSACRVRVIDYGNAYLVGDERCSYIQSRSYRAPEVVLGVDYSTKVDLWSLGCILMELATGHLLFDNRSVQQLLASQIALRGPMPLALLRGGKLARHYFAGGHPTSPSARGVVARAAAPFGDKTRSPPLFKMSDDGSVSRLTPHRDASIAKVLERHAIVDPQFASFVCDLLTPDPELRPSAATALEHPWLTQGGLEDLEPYAVDATFGGATPAPAVASPKREASVTLSVEQPGLKLAMRYPSLRDEEHADGLRELAPAPVRNSQRSARISDGLHEKSKSAPATPPGSRPETARVSARRSYNSVGSIEEELPGPLTPPEFREKAYAQREKQTAAARQLPASRTGRKRSSSSRKAALKGLLPSFGMGFNNNSGASTSES